jgi:hypothetical protein
MGMNMKLLISTVDPLAAGAPPDAEAAVAGVDDASVDDAGELVPPPFELEPHAVARADTAINAIKTKSARRGRSADLGDVSARFMSAPSIAEDGGRVCLIMATAGDPREPAAHTVGFTRCQEATRASPSCQGSQAGQWRSRPPIRRAQVNPEDHLHQDLD